ncbi:putative extracellular heme-binding protein [Pseudomonas aeruginosa]|nr:putative extracellular heme-binding protein [Pseudomonas aeruginosa]
MPHDDRGSLFGSQAKSGSAAFAYRNEHLDLVAAYAQRNQGNYFSGKKGQDRYRVYNRYGREESSVAKVYNAGEEVLNSSSETESYLLKATWRIADEHTLDLGYRRYDGRTGEIMPSDIFRFGTAGIYQYPLSEVKIDTYTARYRYLPENNPLVDLSTGLWMTEAKSDMLTSVLAPRSPGLSLRSQLDAPGQPAHRRRPEQRGALRNRLRRFQARPRRLVPGRRHPAAEKRGHHPPRHQRQPHPEGRHPPGIRPQRQARVQAGRAPDAMGRRPLQPLQQQGQRHLRLAAARGSRHALHHGEQARLLRLDDVVPRPERPVHRRHRSPPQQRHRHQQHQQSVRRHSLRRVRPGQRDSPSLAGHQRGHRLQLQQEGAAAAAAVSRRHSGSISSWPRIPSSTPPIPKACVCPSLFETSQGTLQVEPGKDLKPERSRSWEIGASALRDSLLADGDSAAIKLAYFNNTIKNYITRYYDPGQMGLMTFSNTDSYRTSGLELQSHYDAGRVFADLSATYYLKTETCDAAFAARLRAGANRYQRTENTPNCTPGSFMGSYTNTQNPPRLATNLTAGLRFFDQALTLGGRMTYTSGPTATADKPWQVGATTPQIEYRSVQLFDLFLKYKLFEHTELNASLQNLTDRYYLDPLAQSFMPAPGRTLRVGMQAKF